MKHTVTQEQLDNATQDELRWKYPGVTGPGSYTWNEQANRYEPASKPPHESPHDFSHSGLGIGGAGSHDLDAETAELVARGEMVFKERKQSGPMPHGQLWEECSKRGCHTEPVCVDCLYCKQHCRC